MIQRKFLTACSENKIDIVRELLEKDRDQIKINDLGNGNRTPLHRAVVNLNIDLVRLLVQSGCDINISSIAVVRNEASRNDFFRFEEPPLVTATRLNNSLIAEYLIDQKCLVDKKSILLDSQNSSGKDDNFEPGITALHYAAFHYNVSLILKLANHGANVNAVDYDGNIPLHMAVACKSGSQRCRQQVETVSLLCKLGSDPSVKNRRACSALLVSVLYGCFPSVEVYLGCPIVQENMNSFALDGHNSPLHVASYKGRHDILNALIKAGHKLDSLDHKQLTPLQINVNSHSNSPVALTLIYHGCDVNCFKRPPFSQSVMTITIKNPRFDCESLAFILVKVGYDLNQDTWLIPDDKLPTNYGCISKGKYFTPERLRSRPVIPSFDVPKGRIQKLKIWLQEQLREPRSLSDLCIVTIRRCIYKSIGGISIENSVKKLCLPRKLESFILLQNFVEHSESDAITVHFEMS